MDVAAAKQRSRQLAHLHAFISLGDERGPGEVVGVKDLVDVEGQVTSGGGIILPAVPARRDATVVSGLRRHGCVMLGKTNLHEWAYGITSKNPHYGAVLNPHDPSRIAGGSSGGSAVAVATEMCDWAIGSDTGGSIRIPASLCGVVGLKPTYGSISTEGVIPLSHSLDTLGPLARTVAATADAFMKMSGRLAPVVPDLDNVRLAVPAGWVQDLDPPTASVWEAASHDLPEIEFPARAELARCGDTILRWEAAHFHRQWMERFPERYGRDVLERLQAAAQVTEVEYQAALEQRTLLREAAAEALRDWSALVLPTTARVAPPLDDEGLLEPLTRFTRPFNTTGQPVLTLPFPTGSLPVGIQLVGQHGDEAALLGVGLFLEKQWASRPPVSGSGESDPTRR